MHCELLLLREAKAGSSDAEDRAAAFWAKSNTSAQRQQSWACAQGAKRNRVRRTQALEVEEDTHNSMHTHMRCACMALASQVGMLALLSSHSPSHTPRDNR